jgi:hypothetical protein
MLAAAAFWSLPVSAEDAGPAGVPAAVRKAETLYWAGKFADALSEFQTLSAAAPADTYLRLRVLQCKLFAGKATPADDAELRTLRAQWAREVSAKLAGVRDAADRATALAREGKAAEATELVRDAEARLNVLGREVDVSAVRRRVADALRTIQTAPAAPAAVASGEGAVRGEAVAADADFAPARGRHRLVKEGDTYRIVAAAEPVAAGGPAADAAAPAPVPAPGNVVVPPVPPAPVPPLVVPAPIAPPTPDLVPRPVLPGPGLAKEDVIWQQSDFVDLPAPVRADILTAQKYIRMAPKYYYERMLYFDRMQSYAANLVQLQAETVMPVLLPPHDYVAAMPPRDRGRKALPEDVKIGDDGGDLETWVYDTSFLALSDGPFDGLSYSRYLFNGYEGSFVWALTNPGVPFYSPTFVGGGFPGVGGVPGRGLPGYGFGGFPSLRSQIYGGSAADFAYGHPAVLNGLFDVPFGYRDPVLMAQLINTLNVIVKDPTLTLARPRQGAPMPQPQPQPQP